MVFVSLFYLINCNEATINKTECIVGRYPVTEVSNLAFDHAEVLKNATRSLQEKLKNEPIGFEMLPKNLY